MTTFVREATAEQRTVLVELLHAAADGDAEAIPQAREVGREVGLTDADLEAALNTVRARRRYDEERLREIPDVVDHTAEKSRLTGEITTLQSRVRELQAAYGNLDREEAASSRQHRDATKSKRDRCNYLREGFEMRPFPKAGEIAATEGERVRLASRRDELNREDDRHDWRRGGRRRGMDEWAGNTPWRDGKRFEGMSDREVLEHRVRVVKDHLEGLSDQAGPEAEKRRLAFERAENVLRKYDRLRTDLAEADCELHAVEARLAALREQEQAWNDDPRNVALPF